MWREARTAYLKSRDAGMPLAIGQPLKMLGESARVASEYLGMKLGVLEVGAAADLIVADYIPGTFVVNTGDMVKLWSNGVF